MKNQSLSKIFVFCLIISMASCKSQIRDAELEEFLIQQSIDEFMVRKQILKYIFLKYN